MPESIELSKFVSHTARMSGEFDSRKDSRSAKFELRPQIFIKQSLRELCDSKLSDLHSFDNTAIIHRVRKGRLLVHVAPIFEVIFVTFTKNSSVATNDSYILKLFLYPQADRSRLGNPKKDLCNNFFAPWLTNFLKGVHFGMWFYFLLPSLILTLF